MKNWLCLWLTKALEEPSDKLDPNMQRSYFYLQVVVSPEPVTEVSSSGLTIGIKRGKGPQQSIMLFEKKKKQTDKPKTMKQEVH